MSEPEKKPVGFIARLFSKLRKTAATQPPKATQNNFTPRSQQVLVLARREAVRLGRDLPDTEHLLLGLIRLNQGVAISVLIKRSVVLETMRVEVEKQAGIEPRPTMSGKAPFSDGVKKILSYAAREARALNHTQVGTGPLLLGMLREKDGVAGRVLRSLGFTVAATRAEVLSQQETNISPAPSINIADSNRTEPACMDQMAEPNFTPRALQVLLLAQIEAEKLGHNYIGTEHYLLGLITLGQGCAFNVLRNVNANFETLRAGVVKEMGNRPPHQMAGAIQQTRGANKVIEFAAAEAKAQSHKYVGTEYLLLGMLREGDGIAGRVLRKAGLGIDKMRIEVLKELDPNYRPAN